MLPFALVVLIGLTGGVAVGIQSPIAGAMGQKVGGTASSVIVPHTGTIIRVINTNARDNFMEVHVIPAK